MQGCIECGVTFAPRRKDQKCCSPPCKERFKKKRQRLRRQEAGLCPYCGMEMDYPVRIGPGGGQKIKYCSRCRERFREIKKRKSV